MENVAGDDIDRLLEDGMSRADQKSNHHRDRHHKRHRNSHSQTHADRLNEKKRVFLDRDDCTIFACHIHPGVDDRDIFDFFSQCGTVKDIVIMRDSRSGTSKGYCYIEFGDKESVINALTVNGQYLGGSPIMVSVSNAEKNRAVSNRTNKGKNNSYQVPSRLYVSNIAAEISADDLEPVFGAFGMVDSICINKQPDKTTNTKSGYVDYKSNADATFALSNLKDISLLNKTLQISLNDMSGGANPIGSVIPGLNPNVLDEGKGGLQLNPNSRVMLMQRLQASGKSAEDANTSVPAGNGSVTVPKRVNSRFVLLKNLFDPKEETEKDWEREIEEDVRIECSKFGFVESCILHRNSSGHIYLAFKDCAGAKEAVNQLNNRWFAQKQIAAEMIADDVYQRMCPRMKGV